MANKGIPIIDKELVIQRIAEGQSTRQAIQGTSISSNQTAARLAKEQSHRITQLREEYMEAINRYASSRDYRAAMLADMVWADKPIATPPYTAPDWNMRLKAIQYIDMIAGITNNAQGTHINVIQQVKH